MFNRIVNKKPVTGLCMLFVAMFALLVSSTQASNGVVTVLLFAPDSDMEMMETAASYANAPTQLLTATSLDDVAEMLDEVDAVILDTAALGQVDAELLTTQFVENRLVVVGIDMSGQTLADSMGVPQLYSNNWQDGQSDRDVVPETTSSEEIFKSVTGAEQLYYIYALNVDGNARDMHTYVTSEAISSPLTAATPGIVDPLTAASFAGRGALDADSDYIMLLDSIGAVAVTDSVPTAVSLSLVSFDVNRVVGIVILLVVTAVGSAVLYRRKMGMVLGAFAVFVVIGTMVNGVYANDATSYFQSNSTRSFVDGQLVSVHETADYHGASIPSDSIPSNNVTSVGTSVSRSLSQATADTEVDATYTAVLAYCQNLAAFASGCMTDAEFERYNAQMKAIKVQWETAVEMMEVYLSIENGVFVLDKDGLQTIKTQRSSDKMLPDSRIFTALEDALAKTNDQIVSHELYLDAPVADSDEQFRLSPSPERRMKEMKGQSRNCYGETFNNHFWWGVGVGLSDCHAAELASIYEAFATGYALCAAAAGATVFVFPPTTPVAGTIGVFCTFGAAIDAGVAGRIRHHIDQCRNEFSTKRGLLYNVYVGFYVFDECQPEMPAQTPHVYQRVYQKNGRCHQYAGDVVIEDGVIVENGELKNVYVGDFINYEDTGRCQDAPGSGEVETYTAWVMGGKVWEGMWRGGFGYVRSTPIDGTAPESNASEWQICPLCYRGVDNQGVPGLSQFPYGGQGGFELGLKFYNRSFEKNGTCYQWEGDLTKWETARESGGLWNYSENPTACSGLNLLPEGVGNVTSYTAWVFGGRLYEGVWLGRNGYVRERRIDEQGQVRWNDPDWEDELGWKQCCIYSGTPEEEEYYTVAFLAYGQGLYILWHE